MARSMERTHVALLCVLAELKLDLDVFAAEKTLENTKQLRLVIEAR